MQLSTTYEKSSNRLIGGKVKWKMTLYKAPLPMYLHSKAVRLLDANGFELVSQRIRAFNPVSGTDFVEGFGETMVPEEVYMRAKDYSAE